MSAPAAAVPAPRASQGELENFLRVFFVGGLYAFRALFSWVTPWVYVPVLLVQPLFQILFFAFIGRAAGIEDDSFFVVGNAVVALSIATIFAMLFTIEGERGYQTLAALVATPASRVALFLGRSVPVVANGAVVAAMALLSGSLVLRVHVPVSALGPLALTLVVVACSSTGLGLVVAAIGLRYRGGLVLANMAGATFLIVSGANIPRDTLPGWMQWIGDALPLTRAIEAARELVAGGTLGDVGGLLAVEALIGLGYGLAGYRLLLFFERQGRRHATLEVF
ncbi:MAG TPA: ABC transporter permease [Gaiellaceae bacterium]|nr:ABC transporter permease [Gaiellaceae bacterium]